VSHALFLYAEGIAESAIDEMLSLLDEPSGQWIPKIDAFYWTVDGDGTVYEAFWQDDEMDKARAVFGNCFKSRQDAEQARGQVRAVLVNFHKEHEN
jgi:hypothetical protein